MDSQKARHLREATNRKGTKTNKQKRNLKEIEVMINGTSSRPWVQIPGIQFTNCVTLGKLLSYSGLQFHHL